MHLVFQYWGDRDIEVPGDSWSANLAKSVNSKFTEKPLLKNEGGDSLKKIPAIDL